ncbi:Acyl-CoA synthetase (AMP-forming)/AMP-acid ligase II [Nocardioides terrae]|uniref:Acyl-CoA synthetase (AMP-forming)/AMP-acid ligase II n=1 Tax=Nocardioides terrae TaxID=574651 RepID=A0A1I1N953_9ACTN|nr:AMP-binding protein [Nocardioides terrae]SFC94191.1 Acyl-CoA synthetase (AMP-forming)/AMP-acid ligase II [Nocardioides terrae]
MQLVSLPETRAQADPDGRAVSDATRTLTNAQFRDEVRAAAEHLRELGIGPGAVVALRLTNRIEFVTLLFAAWRLGATITPVNPSLTAGEVERQLTDSDARLAVIEDDAAPVSSTETLRVGDLRRTSRRALEVPRTDPRDLALLIYTSGTTGVPKGVMLDHANLDAMISMGRLVLELGAADRCLLILPLFHVNGIVISVLLPLCAGASVVIAERFDPTDFFDRVAAERPTYFSAVPTIFAMLAALPPDVAPETSTVRYAICGAAPAAPALLERFEARYGFPVVEGYGLSEATCGVTINPIAGPRRPGTVGSAFPGQEVRILDGDGSEVPLGVPGEVVVRGPNVMRGYLGRPEETAKVLVDGWLRTGDLGYLDGDGYLTLVGRSKDLIIRGGANIYPKEIEDVLAAHPAVQEAAVIGAPDPVWGEVVVAYVEAAPGHVVDPVTVAVHCERHLSGYKRPVELHVLDVLPRNALGKVAKPALRERHAATEGEPAGSGV